MGGCLERESESWRLQVAVLGGDAAVYCCSFDRLDPGYYVAIAISAIDVFFYVIQEKSLSAWPLQVRVVCCAWPRIGLWSDGTFMS